MFLLDISNHQGAFPVGRAVNEGFSAVFCKATEGVTYRDPRFDSFIPQVTAAGAIPGAYHFLRAGDGAAQARAFHTRIRSHGGPAGWLCACDNEADASWSTTMAFFAEWNRLTNHHPLIMYSGAWWWKPRGWNGSSLTQHLWHSRYVAGTGTATSLWAKAPTSWWAPGYGGWPTATLLQFTSTARVAGQLVDVSAFRGDRAALLHLAGVTRHTAPTPTRRQNMILVQVPSKPTIVATDWSTWHDESIPWEGSPSGTVQSMIADGVPLVRVMDTQMARILALPAPGVQPPAVVDASSIDLTAMAADVASMLAPQLRMVAQLADRLGAAGDALGTLNDQPAS